MHDARVAAKLTQKKVQEALKISQSNMSDLEGDAVRSSFTPQLAELYKVDARWLATGEGTMRSIKIDAQHRLFGLLKDLPDETDPRYAEYVGAIKRIATEGVHGTLLSPEERALIEAYREILPEQRAAASAELLARGAEAKKYREHYEREFGGRGAAAGNEAPTPPPGAGAVRGVSLFGELDTPSNDEISKKESGGHW